MKSQYDLVIIGAGVIGSALAYEISKLKSYKILLLEKNFNIGQETTEGNSGVIHGGFDPTPGKLNARLNLEGRKLYEQKWFKELEFPWRKVDSLILAFNQEEEAEVALLYKRGLENGVDAKNLKIIDQHEIISLEPFVNPEVKSALLCTCSYAVDPVALTNALAHKAQINGCELRCESEVTNLAFEKDVFKITINNHQVVSAKYLINAAGHYADVIADMLKTRDFNLITRRGQYRILDYSEHKKILSHIMFMVPTIHGKGVIVAPMIDHHVMVGPTAEDNISKEDTRLISLTQLESIDNLGRKIIPSLNMERTYKVLSGSRSIDRDSDDFVIRKAKQFNNYVNIAGIKSPGLSSAPAIAQYVIKLLNL